MEKLLFLLLSILVSVQARAAESLELCRMEEAIHATEGNPDRLQHRLREFLRDKQFVFVSGYGGCLTREFRDSRSAVWALEGSVPMSMICPPRDSAIEDNVDYIIRRLNAIASRNPGRKIILVGHSKGGAEALETVATHPEFFMADERRGWRLANVVTVSAAFGGSVIADLMLERNPSLDEKWQKFAEENGIIDNVFTRWVMSWFVNYDTPGFLSLSTPISTIRNRRTLANTRAETKEILRRKVFFVTARRDWDQSDMPFFLKPIAKFLFEIGVPNDGLVFERDQRLPELGTHLFEVSRAGHFSLIDASYGESQCRREFTRLMLLRLAMMQETNSEIPPSPLAGATSSVQ